MARRRRRKRHVGGLLPFLKLLFSSEKRDKKKARRVYNRMVKNYGNDPRIRLPSFEVYYKKYYKSQYH